MLEGRKRIDGRADEGAAATAAFRRGPHSRPSAAAAAAGAAGSTSPARPAPPARSALPMPSPPPTAIPVTVDHASLLALTPAALRAIDAAYGPSGLGVLAVSGIPGFDAARAALLPLAHTLAGLPDDVKASVTDPASRFNFGWSHGVETLATGRPDTHKASFYANPVVDRVRIESQDGSKAAAADFPGVARPNLWPDAALPALRPAFLGLGRLLHRVGTAVAAACDAGAAARGEPAPDPPLASLVSGGDAAKGRLLYYYPRDAGDEADAPGAAESSEDAWCGWHADHGLVTALTPPLYLDATTGAPAPCPDPAAGLYVRPRGGGAVRVRIPEGCAAFQAGEAAQVATGGRVVATPHCVRPPRAGVAGASAIARATFALFLQPRWDAPLAPPAGEGGAAAAGVARWRPGDTFGAFSERTVGAYY